MTYFSITSIQLYTLCKNKERLRSELIFRRRKDKVCIYINLICNYSV